LKGKGIDAFTYQIDLSNRVKIAEVAEAVKKDLGMVHILVNNAGIVTGKKLLEISDEAAEKTMAINTNAHFWTIKAFLPAMIEANKGTYNIQYLVHFSSVTHFAQGSKLEDIRLFP
jgi:all-trans-retinol dehydrogenase (NAD+)